MCFIFLALFLSSPVDFVLLLEHDFSSSRILQVNEIIYLSSSQVITLKHDIIFQFKFQSQLSSFIEEEEEEEGKQREGARWDEMSA